jgi:parvulin-like peptidyl-prolyl isomerase
LSFTLWLVIFAFIGTTFLVWGIRSTPGGGMARAGIVARVNKDEISINEYQEAYRNLYEHYRRALGEKFDDQTAERMKLKQKALDDLINQRLIQSQARKMDIKVTQEEVAETIKSNPVFADEGQFSRKRYLTLLGYNRLSPQQYERTLAIEILLTKMQDFIKDAAKVSDAEVKDLYYLASNRVKVEYLDLPSKDFKKEQAESIASRMQGKEGWTKVAAEIKVKPRTTGYLAYNLPFMEVPDPVPFIKTAISLKQGEVSSLVEGKDRYYVLRLMEIRPVDDKMFRTPQKELIKGEILVEKRDRLLKEWLEGVKRSSNIQIEQSLIEG